MPLGARRFATSGPGALLVLFLLSSLAAPVRAAEDPERWRGEVQSPSLILEFFVTFTKDGETGEYAARIDIPRQSVNNMALADVVHTNEELKFSLAEAGADFVLKRSEDGREAKGELRQRGQALPVEMRRLAEGEDAQPGPYRPQTPKPPFPYDEEEVTFRNEADDVTLAGTLTTPASDGPHPAVLLITTAGPQDRDQTMYGHKAFAVIADRLSRRGIAVLRYDDRGVGASTGQFEGATTWDFLADALAGLRFLRERAEIDSKRIGLLGHGEGGLIASMIASRGQSEVDFLALLATPGVVGSEVVTTQIEAMLRATDMEQDKIEQKVEAQKHLISLLTEDEIDFEALRDELRDAVTEQFADDDSPGNEERIEQVVDARMAEVTSPWFQTYLQLDPSETFRRVQCPVLAMNGDRDLQVVIDLNLPAIQMALGQAGNDDVTAVRLRELNHYFQTAPTGHLMEYAQIKETFAPKALDFLTDWICEQADLADSADDG